MVAYLKAFVAYLKAYVFSKFRDWQSMKSMMTVSSMEYVSTLTRSTWAQHDASGTANRRPALPEVLCVSKMMIAYLDSFLGVSPFLQTQDPRVDARIDVLNRDAWRNWKESTTKPA
jgi:hypothetical protein